MPNTPYLTKSEPSVPPVSLSPSLDSSNQIPQISCSPENQTTAFLNVSPSVPQCPTDVLVPSIVPPQTTACLTVPQSRLTETTGLDQPGRMNDLLNHCHTKVTQLRLGRQHPTRIHVLFQKNPQIFFDYLCIYKSMFTFCKLLASLYTKLLKSKII